MIWLPRSIESALLYVKAGTSAEKQDYEKAREQIERAIVGLGSKARRPGLFYIFIRAAQIAEKLGNTQAVLKNVLLAEAGIKANTGLRAKDRLYLLDYCDVLTADALGVTNPPPQLSESDYASVTARYRRSYPLIWRRGEDAAEPDCR
jgi:hypothetical protein